MRNKNKIRTLELENLVGVSKRNIKAAWFDNVTQARKYLGKYRAITSAGDDGAINIHIDDAGKYHCEYTVYRITRNCLSFRTKAGAIEWLKYYIKKIHRGNK